MKLIDIHSRGGTCDRCGKSLVNVAVIEIDGKIRTVGLDCLGKVEITDFQIKGEIDQAVKDARTLSIVKKLSESGKLEVKYELNPYGEKILYWYQPQKGWKWLGLACQNAKGLSRDIWNLVEAVINSNNQQK